MRKGKVSGFLSGIALFMVMIIGMGATDDGCEDKTADNIQRQQQEQILEQGNQQVGMPNITHFRERKMMKDILELRDRANFGTVTYIVDLNGKFHKVCDSVGYGLPYATEFTSPNKPYAPSFHDSAIVAQSDPNGLFSPASADGTWVLCKNPKGNDIQPVYIEPRIVTSPFPLDVK